MVRKVVNQFQSYKNTYTEFFQITAIKMHSQKRKVGLTVNWLCIYIKDPSEQKTKMKTLFTQWKTNSLLRGETLILSL